MKKMDRHEGSGRALRLICRVTACALVMLFEMGVSPASLAGALAASPGERAFARATNDLANATQRGVAERSLLRLTKDRDESVSIKACAFKKQLP